MSPLFMEAWACAAAGESMRPRGPVARLRPAASADCRKIAELFRISSEGVADYTWSRMAGPGESPLDVGTRRYATDGGNFSWRNCIIGERHGEPIGMMHSYLMPEPAAPLSDAGPVDPVLEPYMDLEIPGTLYVSSLAVFERWRGCGLGSLFLDSARLKALDLEIDALSLVCFEANEGARRLYEREGFTVVKRRAIVPHPMIHRTGDALLMRADL